MPTNSLNNLRGPNGGAGVGGEAGCAGAVCTPAVRSLAEEILAQVKKEKKLLGWHFILKFGFCDFVSRLPYFYFGIYKLIHIPEEGYRIQKSDYKGFLINKTFRYVVTVYTRTIHITYPIKIQKI